MTVDRYEATGTEGRGELADLRSRPARVRLWGDEQDLLRRVLVEEGPEGAASSVTDTVITDYGPPLDISRPPTWTDSPF